MMAIISLFVFIQSKTDQLISFALQYFQEVTIRTSKGVYLLTPKPSPASSPEMTSHSKSDDDSGTGSLSPNSNEAIDLQEDEEVPTVEANGDAKKKSEAAKLVNSFKFNFEP